MQAVFEKKKYFQLTGSRISGFQGYLPMFHPHGELLYVTKGAIPITVDGRSHLLRTGEMAVLFPYLTHSYESAPEAEVLIILFDPKETAFDNTLLATKPVCCHTDAETLLPLMERAVDRIQKNRPKTAMSYVNAILGELLELLPTESRESLSDDMAVQLLTYCTAHFSEDITVSTVASSLYISESYVSKLFSRQLGYNFREYINRLRIHEALRLLETTQLRIGQIMTHCGFKNQSSFNRIFRELTGQSPREHRKQ